MIYYILAGIYFLFEYAVCLMTLKSVGLLNFKNAYSLFLLLPFVIVLGLLFGGASFLKRAFKIYFEGNRE